MLLLLIAKTKSAQRICCAQKMVIFLFRRQTGESTFQRLFDKKIHEGLAAFEPFGN